MDNISPLKLIADALRNKKEERDQLKITKGVITKNLSEIKELREKAMQLENIAISMDDKNNKQAMSVALVQHYELMDQLKKLTNQNRSVAKALVKKKQNNAASMEVNKELFKVQLIDSIKNLKNLPSSAVKAITPDRNKIAAGAGAAKDTMVKAFKEGFDYTKKSLVDGLKGAMGLGKKAVVGAKNVISKPIGSAWDKIKEAITRMGAVFLAVGFVKFLKGWEDASKWFGDNANFGQKLAAGLAGLLQSFLGLTDEETKKLAENMSMVFGKIFTWLETTFTGLFQGAVDLVMGLFTGDGSRVWEGIKKIFNTLVDSFGEIAKGILNLFMSPETSEAIVGTITKYLKMIPNAIEAVWGGIRSALSSIIDFVNNNIIKYLPKVSAIKNPFAGGGGGGGSAEATAAPAAAAAGPAAATPTKAPDSTTAPKTNAVLVPVDNSASKAVAVAEKSRENVAKRDTTAAPVTASQAPTVVQANKNTTNNTTNNTMAAPFKTQPGASFQSNDFCFNP